MSERSALEPQQTPFTRVSVAAIEDHNLNKTDLVVYLSLCYHANNTTGKCWPAIPTVAEKARCAEKSVGPSLERLAKAGYISGASRLSEKGDRESHIYVVKYLRDRGVGKSGSHGVGQSSRTNYIHSSNQKVEQPSAEAHPTDSSSLAKSKEARTPHGRLRALFSELYRKNH